MIKKKEIKRIRIKIEYENKWDKMSRENLKKEQNKKGVKKWDTKNEN